MDNTHHTVTAPRNVGSTLRLPFSARRAGFSDNPTHRRLWVDRAGSPMKEFTLRDLIKRYTKKQFGTAVWPHLFRDCLLTSVAVDQPDLMSVSAALLGHASSQTGTKHYNQARMLDASRRYGIAILELRETFLAGLRAQE
jgi:site-specific recombinase XerD